MSASPLEVHLPLELSDLRLKLPHHLLLLRVLRALLPFRLSLQVQLFGKRLYLKKQFGYLLLRCTRVRDLRGL